LGLYLGAILVILLGLFLPFSRNAMILKIIGPSGKLERTLVEVQSSIFVGDAPLEMDFFPDVLLALVPVGLALWLLYRQFQTWRKLPLTGTVLDRLRAAWDEPDWFSENPRLLYSIAGAGGIALFIWMLTDLGLRAVPGIGLLLMAAGLGVLAYVGSELQKRVQMETAPSQVSG